MAYPPPPAQVEEMSESLEGHPECRWLDGHYEWRGRRWLWVSGEWVVPPAGCRYEPGVLDWGTGDPPKLYYTPPRWYAPGKVAGAGRDVDCPPATSCQSGPRRRR